MIREKIRIAVIRSITMLISAAMVVTTMLPILACKNAAYASDSTLGEIAAQFQDESADPFTMEDGSAGIGIEEQAQDLPSSYDLRNVDTDGDGKGDTSYVTPVKFQNPFGSCWGFSAISSAETSILGDPELRGSFVADLSRESDKSGKQQMNLSEKHLVWFTYQSINDSSHNQDNEGLKPLRALTSSETLDLGGKPFYATSIFACGMGPVLEDVSEVKNGEFEYHGKKRLVETTDGKKYKESKVPKNKVKYSYSAADDWSIDGKWRFYQSYRLWESFMLPTPSGKSGSAWQSAINGIKEQILANRAVEIAFRADAASPVSASGKQQSTKYISSNWAHYTYDNVGPNHGVSIIGWDDNYPKENFTHRISGISEAEAARKTTPEHDGAWLVKNSWGAETESFPNRGPGNWGLLEGQDSYPYTAKDNARHTGYFWISYDDKSVSMVEALDFYGSNVKEDFSYLLYQYDYMPVNSVRSSSAAGTVRMANIFESEFDNELGQLSFQTTYVDTKANIKIYELNEGSVSPEDGKLLADIDQDCKYGGYHLAVIPEGIVVPAGRKFSVVVTETSGGSYCSSIQYAMRKSYAVRNNYNYYASGVINRGESMLYTDGSWKDLSDASLQKTLIGESTYKDYCMDNFPIKVFALDSNPSRWSQTGEDGTAFGKGASDIAAQIGAAGWRSDKDPQGSTYSGLALSAGKAAKTSVTLKWKAVPDAAKYVIYGAASGSSNALNKVREVSADRGTSLKIGKIRSSKLKKGKYYKFIVVALDSGRNVLTTSKMIHVATTGGKVKNHTKVSITKPAKAKLSLSAGGSYRIKASAAGKKVSKKIGLRYASTDSSVAEVSSKGVISAKAAGSCRIVVYAQNGKSRSISLTVK